MPAWRNQHLSYRPDYELNQCLAVMHSFLLITETYLFAFATLVAGQQLTFQGWQYSYGSEAPCVILAKEGDYHLKFDLMTSYVIEKDYGRISSRFVAAFQGKDTNPCCAQLCIDQEPFGLPRCQPANEYAPLYSKFNRVVISCNPLKQPTCQGRPSITVRPRQCRNVRRQEKHSP